MKLLISVSLLATIFLPATIYAHTLESDNTVGAILHIDPDDNPRVGQKQGFVLAFRDKTGQFDLGKCDCRLSLIKGEQNIFSEDLMPTGKTDSLNNYTFEQAGIYQIEVVGQPDNPSDFRPFKLSYDIRVIGSSGNSSDHLTPTLVISLALLQMLILLGVGWFMKQKN